MNDKEKLWLHLLLNAGIALIINGGIYHFIAPRNLELARDAFLFAAPVWILLYCIWILLIIPGFRKIARLYRRLEEVDQLVEEAAAENGE